MGISRKAWILTVFILSIALTGYAAPSGSAAQPAKTETSPIPVAGWLTAGPVELPAPVWLGEGSGYPLKNLLESDFLDAASLWPEEGKLLAKLATQDLKWKAENTADGVLKFKPGTSGPQAAFLFCYVESDRWRKMHLDLKSHHLLKAYFDGSPIITKTEASSADAKEPTSSGADVTVSSGKHRLLVVALRNPDCAQEWGLQAEMRTAQDGRLSTDLSPQRSISEDDILNSPQIGSITMTRDGRAVAYVVSQRNPKTTKPESWIEIRRLPGAELERVIRDTQSYASVQWAPDGRRLSAVVPGEAGTSDLWLVDRQTGETRVLLDDLKGLTAAYWSPTGDFLVYSVTEAPKDPEPKVEWMTGLQDRWVPWHSKTHLYVVDVGSGIRRPLTGGTISASGLFAPVASPVSPDGSRVLFITSQPDYKSRPYVRSDMYSLDLATGKSETVFSTPFSISAPQWTPDGRKILFAGGQSIGQTASSKILRNDYEMDLYLLDPATGSLQALTRQFAPNIKSLGFGNPVIAAEAGPVFVLTEDRTRESLYRTDLQGTGFEKMETGVDVVKAFDVSADGKTLAYVGTSLLDPPRLYCLDLTTRKRTLVYDPTEERFRSIRLTRVEDFNFTNARGATIEGWLHYPAGFDPAKKYPLIVHYYGGTEHTARDFNVGYTGANIHQYCANGYAVYILNPSGAPGWGPAFSDLHVNDWGKIVAGEIILGVQKLFAAHPFIDKERIGAYGGSYGGFMTMLLATQTDMFRSLIALYGISNISSYWGAGWWGFLYSGVATAESFPWNRPDIYVGQSPLFKADKIKTPLLLLHGLADINVPVTESEQMYTALKLLGREVSYIRFKGEDHGILGTDENRRLLPQIMLAWWDKYLKGQPEAWDALWEKK
jgi:dipeptidyl aminopeptidase/acylaminoacyl peptidase